MSKKKSYKITKKYSEKVVNEIFRIYKEKGLSAETLVEEAKKKNSPLHSFFQWDEKKAAYQWRLQQARVIINEIKVVVENKEYYAFENVSVQISDEESQREYKNIVDIMDDEELREQVVKKAYNQLMYWRDKYSSYKEFQPVFRAIEKIGKEIKYA
ncbi:MAG: hypothetical protein ACOC5F_06470 [Candidatus Aminicenantaceae bacterium]